MGPGAQVGEVALAVKGDFLSLGQLLNQNNLVRLFHLLRQGDGLPARQHKPLQRQILLDDFAHLLFDFFKVLPREGLGRVDVIVKPVVDGGAYRQLGLGEQPLDGLGQHMRAGVPEGVLALGVFKCQNFECAVGVDHGAQVAQLPVELCCAGFFCKRRGDGLGNGDDGLARLHLAHALIFEGDGNHNALLSRRGNFSNFFIVCCKMPVTGS